MKYGNVEVIIEGYPKEMLCWDNNDTPVKQLVLCEVPDAIYPFKAITEDGNVNYYKCAKDLSNNKRTIKDGVKYGDILIDINNWEYKVLGVVNEVIMLSAKNNFLEVDVFYTLDELIINNYKLKSEIKEEESEDLIHLTIQDISEGKGKGIDPSKIRIKE